jgi:hypothetical protein
MAATRAEQPCAVDFMNEALRRLSKRRRVLTRMIDVKAITWAPSGSRASRRCRGPAAVGGLMGPVDLGAWGGSEAHFAIASGQNLTLLSMVASLSISALDDPRRTTAVEIDP